MSLNDINEQIEALQKEKRAIELQDAQDDFLLALKSVTARVDDGDITGAAEIAIRELTNEAKKVTEKAGVRTARSWV